MLEGALIGAIVGLVAFFVMNSAKSKRYNAIRKSISETTDYSGLFHMASATRYGKSMKFFDSYGALYLIGNKLYYKTQKDSVPAQFDLPNCTLQREPDWRMLKWFSVTTPVGEKVYFNSSKPGAFKNNSDETVRAYELLKAKSPQVQP